MTITKTCQKCGEHFVTGYDDEDYCEECGGGSSGRLVRPDGTPVFDILEQRRLLDIVLNYARIVVDTIGDNQDVSYLRRAIGNYDSFLMNELDKSNSR